MPDIVEILGDRPFPIKDSVIEYLQELREREDTIDETIAEEDRIAAEKRKAAVEGTKFDPDADDSEDKDEVDAAEKADEGASDKTREETKKDGEKEDKEKKD